MLLIFTYELVQAYNLRVSNPRMLHVMTTRISPVWYHADGYEQWKRV